MSITEDNRIIIRDIVQKDIGYFRRLSIGQTFGGICFITAEQRHTFDKYPLDVVSMKTTSKRLIQLANEILSYFKKEASYKEWKPTMQEFEQKIKEVMGSSWGVETWFIDWIRRVNAVGTKQEKEQAVRIYDWLKSNEEWVYGMKEK